METTPHRPIRCPRPIGRDRELALLTEALQDPDRTAALVLAGEAGMGKTRLIREVTGAGAGGAAIQAACFETDRAAPLSLLLDLLRGLTLWDDGLGAGGLARRATGLLERIHALAGQPDLTAAEREVARRRLFDEVAGALLGVADQGAPVLVMAEDLHWADDTSLQAVLHLARRFAGRPAVLLATYRLEEATPELEHLLAELERRRLGRVITLTPLTEAEVAEMVAASLDLGRPVRRGFVTFLSQLSGGNPLFVEEILTGLLPLTTDGQVDRLHAPGVTTDVPLPLSVRDTTRRRANTLSGPARRLLERAAVLGRRFDVSLLAQLARVDDERTDQDRGDGRRAGPDPEQGGDTPGGQPVAARPGGRPGQPGPGMRDLVEELAESGLVVEVDADRLAFRHELTRRAIVTDIPAGRRRNLHGAVARVLEGRAPGDPDVLPDLAAHLYAAGRWEAAADRGAEAGRRALALHEPRAAVAHLTRAVDASRRARRPDAALHRLRARGLELLGDTAGAREDLEQALEMVSDAGDQAGEVEVLRRLGAVLTAGDYPTAGEYLQRALELARRSAEPRLVGPCLNRLGNWAQNRGDDGRAQQLHTEALTLFEELGDRRGLADTHDLLAFSAYARGDLITARVHYQRAVEHLRELDDRPGLVTALGILALLGGSQMGDVFAPAATLKACAGPAREAREVAASLGWPTGEAFATANLGAVLAAQGQFGQGRRLLETALAMGRDLGHRAWIQRTTYFLGILHRDLLDLTEAVELQRRAVEEAEAAGLTLFLGPTAAELAVALSEQGRTGEAGEILQEYSRPHILASAMCRGQLQAARAQLELARGEPLAALAACEHLARTAARAGGVVPRLALLRGRALGRAGRASEAATELSAGIQAAEHQGAEPLRWRLLVALARLHARWGEASAAREARDAADRALQGLAATLPEEERAAFTHRARVVTAAGDPGVEDVDREVFGNLTPRQLEVAALVARGLTNRDIGQELVISPQTAETHVKHILRRLGFSSRSQIATWATERGVADLV